MKYSGLLLGSALCAASVSAVWADTRYEVETDPSTFALDGYAAHLRVWPAPYPNVRVGIGVYSLSLPDVMVDMNSKNKNEGWKVEIEQGLGLFSEYYVATTGQGWFLGLQLAQQTFRIENSRYGSSTSEYINHLVMPYGGYRWQLSERWYMQAWMGLGYTETTSGEARVGTEAYDVDPVISFATMHVGYSF